MYQRQATSKSDLSIFRARAELAGIAHAIGRDGGDEGHGGGNDALVNDREHDTERAVVPGAALRQGISRQVYRVEQPLSARRIPDPGHIQRREGAGAAAFREEIEHAFQRSLAAIRYEAAHGSARKGIIGHWQRQRRPQCARSRDGSIGKALMSTTGSFAQERDIEVAPAAMIGCLWVTGDRDLWRVSWQRDAGAPVRAGVVALPQRALLLATVSVGAQRFRQQFAAGTQRNELE